jgi:hypothetical protein
VTFSSLPALAAAVLALQPGSAPPAPPAAQQRSAETVEQAIDRNFLPTMQLYMSLTGPVRQHPATRQMFMVQGPQKGCRLYWNAWMAAFARHLPSWRSAWHAAAREIVPEAVLFREPRRSLDNEIVATYGDRMVAHVRASGGESALQAAAGEIMTAIAAAAQADASAPAAPSWAAEVDALFAVNLVQCTPGMDRLEGRPNVLGS